MSTVRSDTWLWLFSLLAAIAGCTGGLACGERATETPLVPEETVEIQLPNRRIAPEPGIEPKLSSRLAGASTAVEAVVQLKRPPLPAERDALARRGVELREFLGSNAFLARIEPDTSLSEINLIRWSGVVLPQDKISSSLWKRGVEAPSFAPTEVLNVFVRFQDDASEEEVKEILEQYTRDPRHQARTGRWLAQVDGSSLTELASKPAVRWIEEQPFSGIRPPAP